MSTFHSHPPGFAVRAGDSEYKIRLREPESELEKQHASRCNGTEGRIEKKSGQNVVWCLKCGKSAGYNAKKSDIGEPQRHIPNREGIKKKKRMQIMIRDGPRCRFCGRTPPEVILHVGHLLSVEDGKAQGLSEKLFESDENLAVMCEGCNLGLGKTSVPLWLAIALLKAHDNHDRSSQVLHEQNGILSDSTQT